MKKGMMLKRVQCILLAVLIMIGSFMLPISSKKVCAASTTFSYQYAYDCWRNPAYPKKGDTFEAYNFGKPLIGYENSGTTSSGDWKLVSKGKYTGNPSDYVGAYSPFDGVVEVCALMYNISKTRVEVYELKDGESHIAYGVLCAKTSEVAMFIGDTWDGGGGYVLSDSEVSGGDTITGVVEYDAVTGFDDNPPVGPNRPSADHCSTSDAQKEEVKIVEAEPVDVIAEREKLESTQPILQVKIDTTQFNKTDYDVVPEKAYNLSNFITTSGIVRGINLAVAEANKAGAQNAVIYSGKPICFNSAILKAINDGKTDIVYYFTYMGHVYSVTVPANVDATKILDKAPFAGPFYVGQQLGTVKLVK